MPRRHCNFFSVVKMHLFFKVLKIRFSGEMQTFVGFSFSAYWANPPEFMRRCIFWFTKEPVCQHEINNSFIKRVCMQLNGMRYTGLLAVGLYDLRSRRASVAKTRNNLLSAHQRNKYNWHQINLELYYTLRLQNNVCSEISPSADPHF